MSPSSQVCQNENSDEAYNINQGFELAKSKIINLRKSLFHNNFASRESLGGIILLLMGIKTK